MAIDKTSNIALLKLYHPLINKQISHPKDAISRAAVNADVFKFAKVYIDPATQKKYLSIRSEGEIVQCIERANQYGVQQVKKGKEVNNGALYRTAITVGWHVQQQEKLEQEKQTKIVDDRISAVGMVAAEENRNVVADSIPTALSEFAALN